MQALEQRIRGPQTQVIICFLQRHMECPPVTSRWLPDLSYGPCRGPEKETELESNLDHLPLPGPGWENKANRDVEGGGRGGWEQKREARERRSGPRVEMQR